MGRKLTITVDNIPEKVYNFMWRAAKIGASNVYNTDIAPTDIISIDAEDAVRIDVDTLCESLVTLIGFEIAAADHKKKEKTT